MRSFIIFLLFVSLNIWGKPILKTDKDYRYEIKSFDSFILYLVGSIEMVFTFDYNYVVENSVKKNKKSKKKIKKEFVEEMALFLPVPNPIKKWSNSNNNIFKDLYNASLPELKPKLKKKKKLPKKIKKVKNKFKVFAKEIHKNDEIGKESFEKANQYLKKNGYSEVKYDDYSYYIDRKWSFIVIKYGVKKGKISGKGQVQPLHLSMDGSMVSFPLRILKDTGKVDLNIYVLSQFDLDMSEIKTFGLKIVEMEDSDLIQKNRLTIITELGDSVIELYDKIAETNEIFKDMENNNIKLFHFYGKNVDAISKWGKNTDFQLNNK